MGTEFKKVPEALERTALLFGENEVEFLRGKHVAVFGLGGVGGHACEALARSGIGEITLIDGDEVTESNLNRQMFATAKTVGMRKTDAAERRLKDVARDIKINKMDVFVTPENVSEVIGNIKIDYIIDAIDTVSSKLAIIEYACANKIPIISSMGAGNKVDPTRFEVADIYKTSVCPLAAVVRRECRKRGIKKLKVVFSREERIKPSVSVSDGKKREVPGSCAFVPSVCGLIIAGEVVKDFVKEYRSEYEKE